MSQDCEYRFESFGNSFCKDLDWKKCRTCGHKMKNQAIVNMCDLPIKKELTQ